MSNKVTVTPSVMKPKDVHHVGIEKSFERIRDGKSRKSVEEIRNFQIFP